MMIAFLALLAWLAGSALIAALLGGKEKFVKSFVTFNLIVLSMGLMGGATIVLIAAIAGIH